MTHLLCRCTPPHAGFPVAAPVVSLVQLWHPQVSQGGLLKMLTVLPYACTGDLQGQSDGQVPQPGEATAG